MLSCCGFIHFQKTSCKVAVCVAKIILLLDDGRQNEAEELLDGATELGSGAGAFLKWQMDYKITVGLMF